MLEVVRQVGRQAALESGLLLRQNYARPKKVRMKGVIDPVTGSDLKSQELIVSTILMAFPEHQILAEELGAASPVETSGRCRWIIDPLDGTVNFAHEVPIFAVSIAFEQEGSVRYGIVYDPMKEEIFEAQRGQGAWLNGRRIKVSNTKSLNRALLATGFPYDIRDRLEPAMQRFGQMLACSQGVRRLGSAALNLCYLAAGRFDGLWSEQLNPWDTAAASLIVSEAGGVLSTFANIPFKLDSPNVVASNGHLHLQLIQTLQLSSVRLTV